MGEDELPATHLLAKALGIGLRTAKRDRAKASSWLYAELDDAPVA